MIVGVYDVYKIHIIYNILYLLVIYRGIKVCVRAHVRACVERVGQRAESIGV